MSTNAYIPSFYFYKFANAVSAPYTSLSAYNSGLIDEQGNITGNESSIDEFEYFVIKLKKIFEQLPPGLTKARLTSIVGISQLFSEDFEMIGVTEEQVVALIEAHVTNNSEGELSFIELMEDMGVGAVAGEIGVPADAPEANKGNVSGYDPKLGEIMTRSAPVNMFQGIEMFNVSPEEFKRFKQSKAWKTVPDSPTKRYLQRFQRRNKEGKMAVRDETSGEIFFVPYKEKSFMEEFNLEGLSILSEQRDLTDPFRAALIALEKANTTDNDNDQTRGKSGERAAQAIALTHNVANAIKQDGLQGKTIDRAIELGLDQARKPVSAHGADTFLWTPRGEFKEVDAKQVDADRGTRIYPGDDPFEMLAGLPEYTKLSSALKSGAPIDALKALNRELRIRTKQLAPGTKTVWNPENLSQEQQEIQKRLQKFVAGVPTSSQTFVRTQGKRIPNYWGPGVVPLVPKEVVAAAGSQSRVVFNPRVFQRKPTEKNGKIKQLPPEMEIGVRGGNPASRGSMERMKKLAGLEKNQTLLPWSASFQDVDKYGKSEGQEIYNLQVGEEDWDTVRPFIAPNVADDFYKLLRGIG